MQVAATAWAAALGVRFYADGIQIGTEDISAPFTVSWDTATMSGGTHTLTAVARDLNGNKVTSAAVVVSVSNATRRRGAH